MATVILWIRNDLRLDDNPALVEAARNATHLVPVHVIDPAQYGTTRSGLPRCASYRARFQVESLAAMRESLRAIGSELVIRRGQPAEVLGELIRETKAGLLVYTLEAATEERRREEEVVRGAAAAGCRTGGIWQATMTHRDDLPFGGIEALPDIFTEYRKAVERRWLVRPPLAAPTKLPPLPAGIEPGELPAVEDLSPTGRRPDPRAAIPFAGGEKAARARLDHYFWKTDGLAHYKQTRNGLLGADYSSKFSAWLANGSISPRRLYSEVRRYEQERLANDSTYWLLFELHWRDYFRFVALKYGSRLFRLGGLGGRPRSRPVDDPALLAAWQQGRTGYPFVDANMIELRETGFMSNRGRQNVASFLVRDLGLDWRLGAEWFESLLIDYDPCSNYGNWTYVAGVGNDPREDRYFNVVKQAQDYDPKGEYIRHWIPDLAGVRTADIHQPGAGGKYIHPVVPLRGRV